MQQKYLMDMGKNNIATSVEQSKRLLELGIDPNTASMIWASLGRNCAQILDLIPYKGSEKDNFWAYRPAWTLGDLIAILPQRLNRFYSLHIDNDGIFYVGLNGAIKIFLLRYENEILIDVAVRAIEELKERGLM